jgi:DDE superfamily endonuclease
VTRAATLLQADELRLGLHGQVRRVLAPRGVKVVQPVQIEYRWRYLLLGVEPRTGVLRWRWLERFRQDQLKPVLADWAPDAVVWDGAGAHRGKQLGDLPTVRIFLPPYSPELNPAERVLEEIRRRVEGRVYDSLDAKQAEVDAYLRELAAYPGRVKRLCGWAWILDAAQALPAGASQDGQT